MRVFFVLQTLRLFRHPSREIAEAADPTGLMTKDTKGDLALHSSKGSQIVGSYEIAFGSGGSLGH
ncbi:MAG: hypothetical protein Q4D77_00695 [Peptostreptococcaceae bacterium]|nr:hypothetical protein [Peptostreptococcaceae bacterium]